MGMAIPAINISVSANRDPICRRRRRRLMREARLPAVANRGGALPPATIGARFGIRRLLAACGQEPPNYEGKHASGDDWLFVGTVNGGGDISAGSYRLKARAGDLFLMPPGWRFKEAAVGSTDWQWVLVRALLEKPWGLVRILPDTPTIVRPGWPGFEAMQDIAETLHTRPAGFVLEAVGKLLALIAAVEQALDFAGRPAPSACVARACELMRGQFHAPPSVPELARHCAVSVSSLAHRFKAETGVTPMEWFRHERMRRARELLLEGRQVKEVAATCGFANPFHFSRIFRQSQGLPPARFQRLIRVVRSCPKDASLASHKRP